ncbi:nitrous oxide reductase family maturation protein NosD [Myxococcota bacterium]
MATKTTVIGTICWLAAVPAWADPVTPGQIRSYATPQSIGIEWDVNGDSNHNATAAVEYSVEAAGDWKSAMPLFRVDSKGNNMLAGSILFLRGGTSYEMRLTLADPDGGGETRTLVVATPPIPELADGGSVFHVAPGSGGGSGTEADPYLGVDEAQQHASSGDTFLLHAGAYGGPVTFNRGGSGDAYIAWIAAGDGIAHFDGVRVGANRVWLEGLEIVFRDDAIHSDGSTRDVVIRGNTVTGCHYCIRLKDSDEAWWISDNIIVGDEPPTSGSLSGEGIELSKSPGHTVAHNSVSFVADGVSYPSRNTDIFGNDIFECSDDGIEPDYGFENIRVWGNRIHHAHHNGISFQPMDGGPWYVLRNQVIGSSESALKMRDVTHAFVAHNTFVAWDRVLQSGSGWIRNMMTRNNLFVSVNGDYIIEDTGSSGVDDNWRTDLDYDGFAWGDSSLPKFKWMNTRYDDLAAFQTGSGHEPHAVQVPMSCLETLDVPGAPPAVIPPHLVTLADGCNAVDAGEVLPNINDGYVGDGPDLGAHEQGAPAQHYGPRATTVCGDGRIEGDEVCDPPATCPTECTDPDPCTTGRLEGDAQQCTSQCWHDPITTCTHDDGCCPASCDDSTDHDCSTSCSGDCDGGDAASGGDAAPRDAEDDGSALVSSGCNCRSVSRSDPVLLALLLAARTRRRGRSPSISI